MDNIYNRTPTMGAGVPQVGGNMGFLPDPSQQIRQQQQSNAVIPPFDKSAWLPSATPPPLVMPPPAAGNLPDKLSGSATAILIAGAGLLGSISVASTLGWHNSSAPVSSNAYYIAMNEMYNRQRRNKER
ncbi:hypothetical protein MRX96_040032 [Rhipicephalus microplus]